MPAIATVNREKRQKAHLAPEEISTYLKAGTENTLK